MIGRIIGTIAGNQTAKREKGGCTGGALLQ